MDDIAKPNYISMTGRARVIKIMIFLCIATSVLAIGSDMMENQLLQRAVDGEFISDAEAEANDSRQAVVGLVAFVILILFKITFFRWVFRSNKNLISLGVAEPKYSAGWAVGYFFIPILNLFRPYQAMVELAKASSEKEDAHAEATDFLKGWWGLWVLSNYVSSVVIRVYMKADTAQQMIYGNYAYLVSYLIDVAMYLVTLKVVMKITAMQEVKSQKQQTPFEVINP